MNNEEREDFKIAMSIVRRLGKLPYAPENILLTDRAKREYTNCVLDAADLISDHVKDSNTRLCP